MSATGGPFLVRPTPEENADYLRLPHRIIGAFNRERLVAYCSLVFPGTAPNNHAWDLGWLPQRVEACGKVDSVVADPAFRGWGSSAGWCACPGGGPVLLPQGFYSPPSPAMSTACGTCKARALRFYCKPRSMAAWTG